MEIALEKLPINERLRLVQSLWDSIVADNPSVEEFPLTDAQTKLIDKRLANMSVDVNEKPKNTRQFGICKDKGSFVIKDDFEMTAEELLGYE